MKKLRILLLLIGCITFQIADAQKVLNETEVSNEKPNSNPYFLCFPNPYYVNLGEKGILRMEGCQFKYFDSDLDFKWKVEIPNLIIKSKLYSIRYFKIVASNEFIYIVQSYQDYESKVVVVQIDFHGNIIADKTFDDITSKNFSIIDCFASSDGCHYVLTNFYKEWGVKNDKKDFLGTFSKDGLVHSSKNISLPFDQNEREIMTKNKVVEILAPCVGCDHIHYFNYYYTDAEIGKGYYGDNIPARLTRWYFADGKYLCQTALINKNGEIVDSILIDRNNIGSINRALIGGASIYCDEQKLFYTFLQLKKSGEPGILRILVADDKGMIVNKSDLAFEDIFEKLIKSNGDNEISKSENPTLEEVFYDNFNDCLVLRCNSYFILLNRSLEFVAFYKNALWSQGPKLVFSPGGSAQYHSHWFSPVSGMKPSENYASVGSYPELQFAEGNLSKNGFDYIAAKTTGDERENNISNTIISEGDFQYVFIDNWETKTTTLVKLGKQ